MTKYKHRVVQGLADLIEHYGGGGKDLMMRAIWMGIRGEVPMILQQLDDSEEAIALIESKLREVLDIREEPKPMTAPVEIKFEAKAGEPVPKPIEEIKEAVAKAPPRRRRRTEEEKMENVRDVAEVEWEV